MKICGLNKTTLLDYPGKVACTIFIGGCNFRCPFCHNGSLVLHASEQPEITPEEIFTFLKRRKGILEGVCVTGGEPTLYSELPEFLQKIHSLGYAVKLDTNGYMPEILSGLLAENLLDYVAMDIKTGPSDYSRVAGLTKVEGSIFASSGKNLIENVKESIHFLMNDTDLSRFTYEFRTTVVRELHNADSFLEIGNWIQGASHYYLQSYKDSETVLCPGFHSYSKEELSAFADLLRPMIPSVTLRGVD